MRKSDSRAPSRLWSRRVL